MDDLAGSECWYFGLDTPDWSLFARLALYPQQRVASWWTVLARSGEQLLVVRDDALDLPKRTLEVRGPGLWADVTAHDRLLRWQVNFEGVAVGLDDPNDAAGRAYGDRVAMEFELEWEKVEHATAWEVHGEVEIMGAESLKASASRGWRGHVQG